ncbi:hydrogenase maturation protease [bacterium]|nr:hydrogenase maturation protease [bacterium]
MEALRIKLLSIFQNGKVAIIGLGNPDRGDDALGIYIADNLKAAAPTMVFSELDGIETHLYDLAYRYDLKTVIFIDAVDFGGLPGDIELFEPEYFPKSPVTSHQISLRLMSAILRKENKDCCLLGIQPQTLNWGEPLSPPVLEAISTLTSLLGLLFTGG